MSIQADRDAGGHWQWTVHVYAAYVLAIASPVYGRLEERVQYLIGLAPPAVALVAIFWSLILPGGLIAVIAGTRRLAPRFEMMSTQITLGTLFSLLASETLKTAGFRLLPSGAGWLIIVASIALGVAGAAACRRLAWVRSLLNVIAAGSVLLPASLWWIFVQNTARTPEPADKLPVENPVPVVMVVFDCFCGVHLWDDKRQIDTARYPRFAELSQTSNWYRNCTSVHPRTERAVPALLTGLRPGAPVPANVQHYPQNLFTLLKATQKYSVTAFEPFTWLCPPNKERDQVRQSPWSEGMSITYTLSTAFLRDLIPEDVPIDLPQIPKEFFGLSHVVTVDRNQRRGLVKYGWDVQRDNQFQHFLDCIDRNQATGLWVGHFALPHPPWNYLPSGAIYEHDSGLRPIWGAEGLAFEDWSGDSLAVRQANQRHLLQLGFTDRLVGRLMDHLRAIDLFDRCLLVVVADHGISFRTGTSGRLPTSESLADIMSVPLFIKLPNQKSGDVIDLNVETIDVVPTILDVLGIVPAKPVDGQSVVAADFVERPQKIFVNNEAPVDVAAAFESKNDLLVEQLSRFGTGADPQRIFRIGPHSELLDQPVSMFQVGESSKIIIHPMNFEAVVHYPAAIVPVHLKANLEWNEQASPAHFAIAVNGIVRGTTQSYGLNYLKSFWSVMLPESALRKGENQIAIYQIIESPTGLELRECRIGSPSEVTPQIP